MRDGDQHACWRCHRNTESNHWHTHTVQRSDGNELPACVCDVNKRTRKPRSDANEPRTRTREIWDRSRRAHARLYSYTRNLTTTYISAAVYRFE